MSDNAICFKSKDFLNFLEKTGIRLLTTPPYNPAYNGAAENSVKTLKSALIKSLRKPNLDSNLILARFLFDYPNTPHCTTRVAPSSLLFKRPLRTRFDIIMPNKAVSVRKQVNHQQDKQKHYYNGHRNVNFTLNEEVLVRDYRVPNKPSWIKGRIIKKIGKCTYLVEVTEILVIWKRHANQICKVLNKIVYPSVPDTSITKAARDSESVCQQSNPQLPLGDSRPKRQVKAPDRLTYN